MELHILRMTTIFSRNLISLSIKKRTLPFRQFLLFTLLLSLGNSQFYFGRNKVHYENFEWQVLPTEHFDIYYYPEEKDIAGATAVFAEDAYKEYVLKFNYELEEKVPLVIYASHIHFQQTNILPNRIPEGVGGFFEFIKGRVVLPYTGRMWDFYHVVRHELVHVFMNHKIRHDLKAAKKKDPPNIPLWFTEGLAEWWSVGWDNQAEMILRDAILFDNLIPLQQVSGFLVYKEGQSFLSYFEQKYGPNSIRALIESYWEFDTFEKALANSTGIKYKNLMAEWKQFLKKKYAHALINEETPPLKESILTQGTVNTSPTIYKAENGDIHLLYISNASGYETIYDSQLGTEKRSPRVKAGRTADYESLHLLEAGISVNKEGKLAFAVKRRGRDVLVIMEGDVEEHSLSHPDIMTIRSPNWSPDGYKIIFSGSGFNGINDLFLWNVVENKLTRLTRDIYADWDPVFSPNGEWILFSSDRGNPSILPAMNLFLINIETGKIYVLTRDLFENRKPIWNMINPNKILFVSTRSGIKNLWSLNLDISDMPNKIKKIIQVTNYHTGVIEAATITADTVIATLFREYGFRIHPIPLLSSDFNEVVISDDEEIILPWKLPVYSSQEKTETSHPYKMQYSFDFAQTSVAYDPYFGFLGGGQLSISDILGNRYYHFLLSNSAQSTGDFLKRFNLAVTMVDLTRRINIAVGGFYFSNDYFDPYQAFYYEQSFGLRGGINLPLNVFQRLEFSASIWHSKKDFYVGDLVSSLLVSNTISWVHDNSLWSPIGPIDGWRTRLTISPIFDFTRSRLHNYTILADFRYYYRPLTSITLAHRSSFLFNDGKDIRRHYIGGSWGIRGYPFSAIYGRKYFLINHELRFPLARALYLDTGLFQIGMGPWQGALFIDAGNAWEKDFPGLIGSVGFGVRAWFGGIVLRWDYGKRTDFQTLQSGWFSDFFFGWNF